MIKDFRYIRSIIPPTIASIGTTTNHNSSSLNSTTLCILAPFSPQAFGSLFMTTITCSTGIIYIRTGLTTTEMTSTNSFVMNEGDSIDIKVIDYCCIKGATTTAQFQALIWGDRNV